MVLNIIKVFLASQKDQVKFKFKLDQIFKENLNGENISKKCFELKNDLDLDDESFYKLYIPKIKILIIDEISKKLDEALFDFQIRARGEIKNILSGILINYKISSLFQKEIINEWKDSAVKIYISRIISDERIDCGELQNLDNILILLEYTLTNEMNLQIAKFKKFYEIEQGNLEEVSCSINLNKNEKCYYRVDNIEWMEERSVTQRINYHGPRMRIKIARGLYYTAGSSKINIIKKDVLQTIDIGNLYFTDKRIIFVGKKSGKNIKNSNILDFDIFSNGIQIFRSTGKPPILAIKNDVDLAALILNRLLEE
ncbi:MAG: hypothetical protein ACRC6U_00815 [Fusobacteriaceae bacterium]